MKVMVPVVSSNPVTGLASAVYLAFLNAHTDPMTFAEGSEISVESTSVVRVPSALQVASAFLATRILVPL